MLEATEQRAITDGAYTPKTANLKSSFTTMSMDSADLLKGQKVIEINHNGAVYRLQATKLGKLILTK